MIRRQKFKIISVSFIVIVGFCLNLNLGYFNKASSKIYTYDQKLSSLKTSGTYENITIDTLSWNNWTWAESQEWCSGQGSLQNPYIIQGHTFGIDNFKDGIKINNSKEKYFIIQECIFLWDGTIHGGSETGISILNSTRGTILNNSIHGMSLGIHIDECEQIKMVNNRLYSMMTGISVYHSEYCTIDNNTVSQISISGIYLSNCEQNTVKNNMVYDCDYGIRLSNSDDIKVFRNTAHDNVIAGIKLEFSDFNNITDNDSRGNLVDGIHLEEECDNNTLDFNDFSNNNVGIEMYYSDFNTITENIAKNNQYYGIRLEVCENNTVTKNLFKNNTQYGAFIEMGSHNNSFSENYFLQNGVHAFNEGLNCSWNSSTIGNYWDNHTAPDVSPQDGIVDAPYTYISGSSESIDYLPIAEDGAPRIIIHSPTGSSSIGSDAPTLIVEVTDATPLEMWYSLDGGLHNYTFYYIEIHYYLFTQFAGVVYQSAWDALPDGSVTIRFYASDVAGNEAFEEVTVIKSTSPGDTPEGLDPGLLIFIVVISIVGGIAIIAVAYIFLKKRRV